MAPLTASATAMSIPTPSMTAWAASKVTAAPPPERG